MFSNLRSDRLLDTARAVPASLGDGLAELAAPLRRRPRTWTSRSRPDPLHQPDDHRGADATPHATHQWHCLAWKNWWRQLRTKLGDDARHVSNSGRLSCPNWSLWDRNANRRRHTQGHGRERKIDLRSWTPDPRVLLVLGTPCGHNTTVRRLTCLRECGCADATNRTFILAVHPSLHRGRKGRVQTHCRVTPQPQDLLDVEIMDRSDEIMDRSDPRSNWLNGRVAVRAGEVRGRIRGRRIDARFPCYTKRLDNWQTDSQGRISLVGANATI